MLPKAFAELQPSVGVFIFSAGKSLQLLARILIPPSKAILPQMESSTTDTPSNWRISQIPSPAI